MDFYFIINIILNTTSAHSINDVHFFFTRAVIIRSSKDVHHMSEFCVFTVSVSAQGLVDTKRLT